MGTHLGEGMFLGEAGGREGDGGWGTYDDTDDEGEDTLKKEEPEPASVAIDAAHLKDASCKQVGNDSCDLFRCEKR